MTLRNQVIALVCGTGFLYVFYWAVKSSWPEAYFNFRSSTDPIISRSIARYLLFRTLPYFVVGLFVSVTLDRLGEASLVPALLTAILHTLPRLLRSLLGERAALNLGHRVLQIAVIILAVWGAYLGYSLRSSFVGLVPQVSELVLAAWTGLFAAVIGAALLNAAASSYLRPEALVGQLRSQFDSSFMDAAFNIASRYDADQRLLTALMAVEAAQRPRWVRRLESLKGRIRGLSNGTYGLMQVASGGPVGDLESVEIACRDFLQGTARLPTSRATPYAIPGDPLDPPQIEHHRMVQILESYNPSSEYQELVEMVYLHLREEERGKAINKALRAALEDPRWTDLRSKYAIEALPHTDSDRYRRFVAWLTSDFSHRVEENLRAGRGRAAQLLALDTAPIEDERVNDAWGEIDRGLDGLIALAERLKLVEPMTLNGCSMLHEAQLPDYDPAPPQSARMFSRVIHLANSGLPVGEPIVVVDVRLSEPIGDIIWIGIRSGILYPSNHGDDPAEGDESGESDDASLSWDASAVRVTSRFIDPSDLESTGGDLRRLCREVFRSEAGAISTAIEALVS